MHEVENIACLGDQDRHGPWIYFVVSTLSALAFLLTPSS